MNSCCHHCKKIPSQSSQSSQKQNQNLHLKKCSRCKLVSYCNRECQKADWKVHKADCDCEVRKLLFPLPNPDQQPNQADLKFDKKAPHVKGIRQAMKQGTPIVCMSFTAQGMVMPGMPLPQGVPKNFRLKQEAYSAFFTGPSTSGTKLGNLQYEKKYKDYYEDIVANEDEWMTFFDHPDNHEHAEHTCGILGTFATIYRQRGGTENHAYCERVLDMEGKVLEKYRVALNHLYPNKNSHDAKRPIQCLDGLEYKYNLIRMNLYTNNERFKDAVPVVRKMMEYEIKYNLDFDNQNTLFMLNMIGKEANAASMKTLKDAEIITMLRKMGSSLFDEHTRREQERVALMQCAAGCGQMESEIGEFKTCSRCQKAFYCSSKCQKGHWKTHKKQCNK